MFVCFKRSLIATLLAAMIASSLVACGSTQPTSALLHDYPSEAIVTASSIALDELAEDQAKVAQAAGVDVDIVLSMQSAGKLQLTVLALCQNFHDDPMAVNSSSKELRLLSWRIATVYGAVTDESRRVNQAILDLDQRVMSACPVRADEAGWFE